MKKTKFHRTLERDFDRVELVGEAYFGRHGVKSNAQGADTLVDDIQLPDGNTTINHMYRQGKKSRKFVKRKGLKKANGAIYSSNMVRARQSAMARYAGAMNLRGKFTREPHFVEDLEHMVESGQLDGVKIVKDRNLGYSHLEINLEAYKSKGEKGYLASWVADTRATEMDGKPITTGEHMLGTGDEMILKAVNEIKRGRAYVEFGSHGGMSEWAHLAALNSTGRDTEESLEGMHGGYAMEDRSRMRVYRVWKGNSFGYVATIARDVLDGQSINDNEVMVNLSRVKEDLRYRLKQGLYDPQTRDAEQLAFAE